MGLFNGSLTYRRFKTLAPLPADLSPDTIRDALERHAFRPLDPDDSTAVRSVGWCRLGRPSDIDFSPDAEDTDGTEETRSLFWDDKIQFALRIDTKKIPPLVLHEEIRKLEAGYRESNGIEQGGNLSRSERRNIKELAGININKKIIPTTGLYDVQIQTRWDGDRVECSDNGDSVLWLVRFFSLSRPIVDEFMELFEETFNASLIPMGVYGLATTLMRDENAILNLCDLSPSIFSPAISGSVRS